MGENPGQQKRPPSRVSCRGAGNLEHPPYGGESGAIKKTLIESLIVGAPGFPQVPFLGENPGQ